jgi:hypothetical protein
MVKPNTSQGNPLDNEKIYEILFVFMDDVLFQYKTSTNEKGENSITQDLEISLNESARINNTFFAFQNQYQEGIYTTDIGVYLRSNRYFFCWIEAKRLPTPDEKDRDLIGYIQDNNTADYWLSKINVWITELANSGNGFWTNEDCLNKYDSNKCYRILSSHKRKNKTTITLHHYWISVHKNK